jgi:hypothetical protein
MDRSTTAQQEPPPIDHPAPAPEPAVEPEPDFQPTKSLFIERHYLHNRAARVHDITSQAATTPDGQQHAGAAYREHACAVGRAAAASAAPATWTVRRTRRLGRRWRLLDGDHGDSDAAEPEGAQELAGWREPMSAWRNVVVEFAPAADGQAAHCGHPVTVSTKSRTRHWEQFVVESELFVWRYKQFREPRYVLEKWLSGGQKQVVAQFFSQKWYIKRSGALAVDTREVDPVVALVTWYIMARKLQRRRR